MASKCKIVNVVLNSNNKASGTNNQATYYMDWSSILKDNTPYYLHFTYIGGANVITGTKLALVYADFNTSNKLLPSIYLFLLLSIVIIYPTLQVICTSKFQ